MDNEELGEYLNQVMKEQNNRSIDKFEGYSPFEMHNILHFTLEAESPISLQKLADADYEKIPLLNLVKYFLDLLKRTGDIKLTAKGFLPTKFVKDIYEQGFMEEEFIASGYYKLYKESDSMTVNLTRILSGLAGLTKKRNGKLSLTKMGEKIASDNCSLLELIFKTMTTKFNWGYYDNYEADDVGQFGYGFTLILLSKYGAEKRLASFYSNKYCKALPLLLETVMPNYGTVESYVGRCYSVRTFERFLYFFGLIEIEKDGDCLDRKMFIKKTELFDKLIKIREHREE